MNKAERGGAVPVKEMPQRRKDCRIGLFGNFGTGNLGNEGSLETLIAWLKRAAPHAHLICICNRPDNVSADHGISSVPISAALPSAVWFKVLNLLLLRFPGRLADLVFTVRFAKTLDAILVPGTGICDDYGERPQAMPYAFFKWALAARLAKRPLSLVSVGAGPINHSASRWLIKWAARMSGYRSYRDVISKDFMKSIGVDIGSDLVFPDVVFGLRAPESDIISACTAGSRITVGVGVMAYRGWNRSAEAGRQIYETYIGKIVEFAVWLLQKDYDVRLLVGAAGDAKAIDDVLRRIDAALSRPAGGRVSAEPAGSLRELMEQIATTDIVVATRYHNIVCALIMARPAISLGYAEKNDVLLADMGLAEFCQHVEKFDNNRLTEQLLRLAEGQEEYACKIREKTGLYSKLLERQQILLSAHLPIDAPCLQ